MKSAKKIISATLAMVFIAGGIAFAQPRFNMDTQKGGGLCTSTDYFPYEELSENETNALLYMREEEKLARDVYKAMYEKWDHWLFDRISASEQRHMDAIGRLLKKYNLEDPVVDDTRGVFTNPDLKNLYDELVATGSESLVNALKAGATIEELDIFDLKERLAQADNRDVKTVFQNLMKGSRNHLRSFVYQLYLEGETYEGKYLSGDEIEAIVKSPRERGPVDENGEPVFKDRRGRGNGKRFIDSEVVDPHTDLLFSATLMARGGHGGNGGGRGHGNGSGNNGGGSRGRGGHHGPGDGTGNGGNGPHDGTGHGKKLNDCVNS